MEQTDERKTRYREINDEHAKQLVEWWFNLQKRTGPRAALRRCSTPEDAALFPDTFKIKSIMPWISYESAAAIAGMLSHVNEKGFNDSRSLATKLAMSTESGRVPFSETRFRQLLSSRDWHEFYTRLRRAVKILDGNVHPLSVADVILRWDREYRLGMRNVHGHSLKFDLSNDYYTQLENTK